MADTQQKDLKETISLTKNLQKQISAASAAFAKLFSLSSGVTLLATKTKEAVKELKNVDKVLTDISRTSHLTKNQLKELNDSAYDKASQYGMNVSNYLTTVQNMYRLGYDNAQEMAELSLLAQSSGNISQELSESYLTASDAAYHLGGNVEALGKILDGQTSIVQNSRTNMEDMTAATAEAAETAAKYGVKAEELSALTALALENTAASGTETGQALSHLFSSLNENNQLKDPIEQLRALATAYQNLDSLSEKQSFLNQFGGTEYTDTLGAVLEHWNSYGDMLSLYASSSGAAMAQASRSTDTWAGSLNQLQNTWNETVSTFANSKTAVSTLNLFNGLLETIRDITEFLGPLGSLGAVIGGVLGSKNLGRANQISCPL